MRAVRYSDQSGSTKHNVDHCPAGGGQDSSGPSSLLLRHQDQDLVRESRRSSRPVLLLNHGSHHEHHHEPGDSHLRFDTFVGVHEDLNESKNKECLGLMRSNWVAVQNFSIISLY